MAIEKSVVLVHIFSVLLGLNSLISTNGLWVELPLMVPRLPESWSLLSYMTFIIQAANIGPIVYGLLHWLYPRAITERRTCYLMLFIGSSAAFSMTFFWDHTVWVLGAIRSLPLFILTFCLGLVDSLSSMVCFPFMALLKPHYMTSYMIGEGLSGFIPTIMAIVQGSDEADSNGCQSISSNFTDNSTSSVLQVPRFSIETFFYGIFSMLIMSFIGFYLLNNLYICKSELNATRSQDSIEKTDRSNNRWFYFLLFLQFYIPAIFYGILPAIQSYSCLPYGSFAFSLSVILYGAASPTMAVLYAIYPIKKIGVIMFLTIFGTCIGIYLMFTAAMSPSPPLEEEFVGKVLLVASWTGVAAAFGYTKVVVASMLNDISYSALFWGGVLIQVGATLGAVLMFVLVAVLNLFQEEMDCTRLT
ncbi:hypothetical protein CHUAL_010801 [Chamberlinius hualienensis]